MCRAVIYKGRGGRELSAGAYTGGGDHERVGCAELSADETGQPRKKSSMNLFMGASSQSFRSGGFALFFDFFFCFFRSFSASTSSR